jgi:queuine tRNA-ribosyltransferase
MGVGSPEDLIEGVARGIDLFDCVLPTRLARNGAVFTPDGRLNLRNAACREDARPIQEDCACSTCRRFSRAYLRHLVLAEEMLAARLNTIHNVHFSLQLMREARQAIVEGRFTAFRAATLARYRVADPVSREENQASFRSRAPLPDRGDGGQ